VSKEKEREVSNPAWTPDGQYLVNRKHFRNTRSLGAGEMWLYHIAGGNGLKLTDRRNWEQNATEPIVSKDGRYVYFTEDVSPGGGFQYNRDAHGQVYVVQRFDRQTGNRTTVIGGAGSALRPQLSPDDKTIAFVRRVGLKSVLWTLDIESGRERPLWDGLDHDQQEAWAIYGTYPGYDWTPDGKSIVIWAGGKINSVAEALDDAQTAARRMIETIEHPATGALKMLGIPFKFSATACSVRRPPPTLGQHSEEILSGELGLDDKAIAELRRTKVV